jgi:hypothetical protein
MKENSLLAYLMQFEESSSVCAVFSVKGGRLIVFFFGGGAYFTVLFMMVHQKRSTDSLCRYDLDLGDGLGNSKIASNLDLI